MLIELLPLARNFIADANARCSAATQTRASPQHSEQMGVQRHD